MFDREQWERWDSETRVMVDIFLERGAVAEVSDEEVANRLALGVYHLQPYYLTSGFAPIDIASYALWNGTSEISSGAVFTRELLEAYTRLIKYPDCPLWKCEEFTGQTEVPKAGRPDAIAEETWWWTEWGPVEDVCRVVRIAGVDYSPPPKKLRGLDKLRAEFGGHVPKHVVEQRIRLDGRRR